MYINTWLIGFIYFYLKNNIKIRLYAKLSLIYQNHMIF